MNLSQPQIAAIAFGILVLGVLAGVLFSALAWRLMHRAGNTPQVSTAQEVYRPVMITTTAGGAIAAVAFVAVALAL